MGYKQHDGGVIRFGSTVSRSPKRPIRNPGNPRPTRGSHECRLASRHFFHDLCLERTVALGFLGTHGFDIKGHGLVFCTSTSWRSMSRENCSALDGNWPAQTAVACDTATAMTKATSNGEARIAAGTWWPWASEVGECNEDSVNIPLPQAEAMMEVKIARDIQEMPEPRRNGAENRRQYRQPLCGSGIARSIPRTRLPEAESVKIKRTDGSTRSSLFCMASPA
jgi:hypothetical protein